MCIWLWCFIRLFGARCASYLAIGRAALARAIHYSNVYFYRLVSRTVQSAWLIICLALFAQNIYAFDESGHRTVARLTVPMLSEQTGEQMQNLFGRKWQVQLIQMSAALQGELSRPSQRDKQALQFTLFELEDDNFSAEKHCQQNRCSVAAILESKHVLMDSAYSDEQKRKAVLYLMHYALQIHIPLNCGLIRDEGGQRIFLTDDQGHRVSFSWIWNYDMYRQLNIHWDSYAQILQKKWENGEYPKWDNSIDPRVWALDSHHISIEQVYPLAIAGVYDEKLIKQGQQLLEPQLMKAAYRSAELLNAIYEEVDSASVEN